MAGVSCVLSEDQFLCSICLDVFTDPVTTPCGHSFCSFCLNKHWDNSDYCLCPMCNEKFSSRPKLKTNICLTEMVTEFKSKPQREDIESSESDVAGPGDVVCDICPEPKLTALKSCLSCQVSYCPKHLSPHNTVPRLKKHQLIAPVQNLEERLCPEHERLLDMFCRDHSHFMCLECSYSDPKNHTTVPLKDLCEEEQREVQQKIQERLKKIQELQRSVELSQENADGKIKEGVEFLNDLMKFVQESLDQFKQSINRKHEEVKEKAEELKKKIESELSALEQRRAQMEEILSSDDHFLFVQTLISLKPALKLNDWTEVSVRAPFYSGRVSTAVSELQVGKLNPKIKKLLEDQLDRVKQKTVDVTLDPDTAHPNLVLSRDHKQVYHDPSATNHSDHPQRFSKLLNVLGKQRFSWGRFYFEVQVKEKHNWWLGVVTESADRKVASGATTPEKGYWKLGSGISQCLWSVPRKVGVFVDYFEGLVLFFDAETAALIHFYTDCCFTESVLPMFSPGTNRNGNNSAPLILTSVV